MREIRSGNLTISTRADKIIFEISGDSSNRCMIDANELPDLLEFLNSYLYSQSNRRSSFRIDLTQLGEHVLDRFIVTIEQDGKSLPVVPVDLSISGIRVESEELDLEVDTRALISMSFGEHSISLPAAVVRNSASSNQTALHFLGLETGAGSHPPPPLEAMFREIEALWLDKALDLEWSQEGSG